MITTCPQCGHTNPGNARYCFFDGVSISSAGQAGPVDPGSWPFPQPFVFPSGSRCANFDQLATSCQKNWDAAKSLLKSGLFESFLGGLGRADLAMAAKEAVQFPDPDRGLDQFIARLPTQAVAGARLQVEPREVRLDPMTVGKDAAFVVRLRNLGTRLLYGSVAGSGAWLQPGEAADSGPKLIQFSTSSDLKITIRGKDLRAGLNPLEGKVIFETSGGTAEVRVKMDVPVVPFAHGVLKGAVTPRQIAEKARKAVKESIPLFENGAVSQWYKSNGWAYPIPGPVAVGLGAVQQFFEALGLAKAPRLQVRDQDRDVKLAGAPGATIRHVLHVSSPDNKPIFVHASSDQTWLSAGKVMVKGAAANIPLEVRQVPNQPGTVLSARVTVTGNGNQRFDIPVSLQVAGKALPVAVAVAALADEPIRVELADEPMVAELVNVPLQSQIDTAISASKTKRKPGVEADNPFKDLDRVTTSPRKTGSRFPAVKGDVADDAIVAIQPHRSRPGASPGRQRNLVHLVPLLLLLPVFIALFLVDVLDPNRLEKKQVEFSEQKDEKPLPKNDPPASGFKFEIGDVEEKGDVKPVPVVFTIEDEPEEKVNKGAPGPVKVDIKDEPEERTAKVGAAPIKVEIRDEPTEVQGGKAIDTIPIDPTPQVGFLLNADARNLTSFGVLARDKQLTFSPDGSTNFTLIAIDGKFAQFGNSQVGRRYFRDAKQVKRPGMGQYSNEIWAVGANPKGQGGVHFNQFLEVVPGGQPTLINGKPHRLLDTVLVRYVIHNKMDAAHKVGMRLMIDTLIGANDGVPFTVPGRPGLVNTFADFENAKDVPDFIQALEKPNLAKPGTIAHFTLKLGGAMEPPSRVSLTGWPNGNQLDRWNAPVVPMGRDSAIILYWGEKELAPGAKREIGFAYGLGTVSSQNATLGVTLGGSFEPGQSFTITAYVQKPVAGQTLTLKLPEGLQRLDGQDVMPVPPSKDTGIITWKAKVLRTGDFPVRVESSTGIAQTKTISIARTEEPTGGKFRLSLDGSYEPGQTFDVTAQVTDPLPKQTLTLVLPPGLVEADKAGLKTVPPGKEPTVRWKVKVVEAGTFQIKVASSTGVTQSKTLTIARPDAVTAGKFRLSLDGSFEPGQTFQVTAKVTDPQPGQKLTLVLPDGLEDVKKAGALNVPPAAPGQDAEVAWTVKVLKAGRFQIKVASSTGVTQSKTLTIVRPDQGGGHPQVELKGDFAPGKTFQVQARVGEPVANQTLTLQLPREGLSLTKGQEQQPVPPGKDSAVAWTVKVVEPGKYLIKVASSTGVVIKKTLTIQRPVNQPDAAGSFAMNLKKSGTAANELLVLAEVTQPVKNQTLTLRRLDGIKLLAPEATQTVPAANGNAVSSVTWKVRIDQAGVFPIVIESSTGQIKTRTLTITTSKGKEGIY